MIRKSLKWLGGDLLTFSKEVAAYQRQTEIARYTGGRQVVTSVNGGPTYTGRVQRAFEEAKLSFPIYVEHLNLPPGTRLVDLRRTKAGTVREIMLPAWETPRIRLQDIRRAHARWVNGGISVDRVIVKKDPSNERKLLIYTIFTSAFEAKNAPEMPDVQKTKLPLAFDVEGDIRWIDTGGSKARHTIVAGITGSGKSNTMEHLMGCYYEQGHEIWLGDPTGGSEFIDYEELATTVAWSAEDCALLLQMTVQEIDRRYEEMGRRRIKFWDGRPLDVFLDELPLALDKSLIIGFDEKDKEIKQGNAGISAMKKIVMRGRRAGVALTVGIQTPRAEDMSGAARSQFPQIICHKVQRSAETTIILGEGAIDEGYNAARLPLGGRAYYTGFSSDVAQIQVFKARTAKEVLNGQKGNVPRVVLAGSGYVPASSRGERGVVEVAAGNGTTERDLVALAQEAQFRLATASKSKWAGPILEVLRRSDNPMGPDALARIIVLVDDDKNEETTSRGRILEVLKTLKKRSLVQPVGDKWELTEDARVLISSSELADFYGDGDED